MSIVFVAHKNTYRITERFCDPQYKKAKTYTKF